MDGILHFFGLCHDAPAHIDLIDVILFGGINIFLPLLYYVKMKFSNIFKKNEKNNSEN